MVRGEAPVGLRRVSVAVPSRVRLFNSLLRLGCMGEMGRVACGYGGAGLRLACCWLESTCFNLDLDSGRRGDCGGDVILP